MELLYTGRTIGSEEAFKMGLVNRVVAKAELEQEVNNLAETIASRSPVAIKLGREAFYSIGDMEYTAAIKHSREVVTVLATSHDTQEGIRSFLEKRQPEWKGY